MYELSAAMWSVTNGAPVRHRLRRCGNRRLDAVLHIMVVTRLRADLVTRAFIARTPS
jgi:hypothetical protein